MGKNFGISSAPDAILNQIRKVKDMYPNLIFTTVSAHILRLVMIHLIITKRYYRCELEHRDTLSHRSEMLLKRKRQQTSIITLYKIDIGQYDPEHKLYIEKIFDLIPSEFNSKNKRSILKNLNENFKFSRYTNSFIWLKDAGAALPDVLRQRACRPSQAVAVNESV